MKRRPRIVYTDSQKALMWDRWQKGESMHDIARLFDRHHPSIRRILTENGGIRPVQRKRSSLALTLAEREVISRGLAIQLSMREIAFQLGRSPSTVSREIQRNGGYASYRASSAEDEPKAYFHIISKDTGFDPLIRHLKAKGIKVQREKQLGEIPVLKVSGTASSTEMIDAIVRNLSSRGHARPRKVSTLSNSINSLFTEGLGSSQVASLVDQLESLGHIIVKNGNVSYRLKSSLVCSEVLDAI